MTTLACEALVLLVAADVGERRHALKCCDDLRRPFVQLLERRSLQRVLILRVARASAGAEIAHRLQEQRGARHRGEFAPQHADHLIGGKLAVAKRLQGDEHGAGVGRASARAEPAAGEADGGIDGRIGPDDVDELRELLLHQLKRDALIGLDRSDQQPGVLLRDEALSERRRKDGNSGRGLPPEPASPSADDAAPRSASADRSSAAPRRRARWHDRSVRAAGRALRAAARRTSSASSSAKPPARSRWQR